jgi:hypothetical protein
VTDDRFSHDAFFIDQLVRPVVNLYRISTLAPGGSGPGEPLAFVRQKRLAVREDIRFYADDDEREELFRLKTRSITEFRGRYDVVDPADDRIGVLQKVFGASLLRSTWRVLDKDEREVATARERSLPVALLRRAIDAVPYGELVPILFHFTITVDGRAVGDLRRPIGLRDRYVLTLAGDVERRIDRRLAIALGVALDALQSR